MKLKHRKVLIIEDDYLQAADYRAAFEQAQCIVLGPVSTEQAALELLTHEVPDAAIVDLNLGGRSFDVARALVDQEIPFIFATGYECKDIPPEFKSLRCLAKPIHSQDLVAALGEMLL